MSTAGRLERRELVNPRIVAGLIAMVAGILLTLDNLDLLNVDPILRLWPLVLVVFGLMRFFRSQPGRIVGLVVAGAGVWLLLFNLGLHPWELDRGLPLLLVLLGGLLIVTAFRPRSVSRHDAASVEQSPTSDAFVLLGYQRFTNSSRRFEGGDLAALAGVCVLDLRQAEIEGTAVIETFAMWGGVEILVPETWTVESRVVPFPGGFSDDTRPPAVDTGQRLLVKGYAVMGGIEVRNDPKKDTKRRRRAA